ncbi:hypothetical protein HA466_0244600 [Hirschfeldia incana]|nr:hypothetical protein HA466_0244600 [Hirschfeldia incana]
MTMHKNSCDCEPSAKPALNLQTSKDLQLNRVVGQLRAMNVGNSMLFGGTSVLSTCVSSLLPDMVLNDYSDMATRHLPPMLGSESHIVIVGCNCQSMGLFSKCQLCY